MGSQRIIGLLLVAIGAALLVTTTTDVGGEVVVLAIGIGFLIAYAVTRTYGLLVPGGILTGLGAGIVVESMGGAGGWVPLGLGLGFLSIALIDQLTNTWAGSGWWWPLIPGGILTLAGGSDVAGVDDVQMYVVPAALIALGLWLLVRPGRRRRARQDSESSTPPVDRMS